eukprot:scaffold37879_cov11388-Isochrysis_galbana.AAC.1
MERLLKEYGLEPARWLQAIRVMKNRTFICVTYHKDYRSNFNLSEAECDELTFKLNKAFENTSKKDYYDKYNTLCPEILKFIRDLNSYYDKDNDSNVCYETSGASKGGKSQLTTLMRILGTGSVATGSFARLKERFESSETKMLTGRDPIRVEHKYVEESTCEPINDFANEVLAKEVLPFTILTLFLTCNLQVNS